MISVEERSGINSSEPAYYYPPTPDRPDKGTLVTYVSYIRKFPIPSAEQEKFLFQSLRGGKELEEVASGLQPTFSTAEEEGKFREAIAASKNVRDVIINCNLAMVVAVARKYYGVPLMDRIQEGNIGLILAVDSFKSDNANRLYSFAFPRIKGAIINARYKAQLVSFPERIEKAVDRGAYIYRRFLETSPTPLTVEELRDAVAVSCRLSEKQAQEVAEIIVSGTAVPLSLDMPFGRHDGSESASPSNLQTLGDTIPDKSSGFEDEVINRIDAHATVPDILASLTPRELAIISARFDLDGLGETVIASDMARKINRSRRRVLQIQQKAFDRAREDDKFRRLA